MRNLGELDGNNAPFVNFVLELDPGDAVLKGPQRLGKALLESDLALPLLIQVAQQRQSCVFQAPNAYLKSLASLYDTVSAAPCSYASYYVPATKLSHVHKLSTGHILSQGHKLRTTGYVQNDGL